MLQHVETTAGKVAISLLHVEDTGSIASRHHSEAQLPSASCLFHACLQPSSSLSFHWKLKALTPTFAVVPQASHVR